MKTFRVKCNSALLKNNLPLTNDGDQEFRLKEIDKIRIISSKKWKKWIY